MSNPDQPDQTPMASPIQDVRKLKQNSQATADEIREFLARMRGKSAREILGAVASSSLGKSVVQAAIAVAVLILILTAVPWGISLAKDGGAEKPKVEEAVAADQPPTETQPAAEGTAQPAEEIDIDGDAAKKAAADQLGVTEEKTAPANVNPLDGSNDDLLKGLE